MKYTIKQSDNFSYIGTSIDTKNGPEDLKGLRTQFLSFHHFRLNNASKILQNAVNSKNGIAVFEAQERSIQSLIPMVFSPLSVLFKTPFIRPFKLGRIIFTYLIPIVLLFVLWDEIVSCLRTYSVGEMHDIVYQLENKDQFNWGINRVKSGPGVILYLLGMLKLNQ